MKKILYNRKFGGFGLSEKLLERFGVSGGEYSHEGYDFCQKMENRTNPEVVAAVEEMGLKEASGASCELAILEIEDDDIYRLEEYDGRESLIFVGRVQGNLLID